MTIIYNPDNYTTTDVIKNLYPDIKKEYLRWNWLLKKTRYRNWTWKNIDLEETGRWNLLPLMRRNKRIYWKKIFFPVTYSLISEIPIYENLMFSILDPGTNVKPHKGWGNHFVRFHLGIDCNDHCDLVIENGHHKEKNGEILMFDDSQLHYAYNHGKTSRVILLFDVLISELEKYQKN